METRLTTEIMLKLGFQDVNDIVDYAAEIGLIVDTSSDLEPFYSALALLKSRGFERSLSELPQAKRVEELLHRSISWRTDQSDHITCPFVDLFSSVYLNLEKPELSKTIKNQEVNQDRASQLTKLEESIRFILENRDFFAEEVFSEHLPSLSVRAQLLKELELIELEQEAASKMKAIYELEAKSAKREASLHGGKDYARPLDWKWRDISAFASIMYFLARKEQPDRSPRGKFGRGGDLPSFNNFLRSMADGLVENWSTKTHLERVHPRPEHISQIDDVPLKLEIRVR